MPGMCISLCILRCWLLTHLNDPSLQVDRFLEEEWLRKTLLRQLCANKGKRRSFSSLEIEHPSAEPVATR